MELQNQIKKYRTIMNLSQEELAEKVYVTRQTVSNWENNKSYPDIHSLLLLSSLFNVSLDQLIKGDIDLMKNEINREGLKQFNRDGIIFTALLILFVLAVVPLSVFFGVYGLLFSLCIWGVSMIYAKRIDKYKKSKDIQTYKEIVSFTEGKQLDEIEKAMEVGKRPYQKVLYVFMSGLITFAVCMFFVWMLKGYIF